GQVDPLAGPCRRAVRLQGTYGDGVRAVGGVLVERPPVVRGRVVQLEARAVLARLCGDDRRADRLAVEPGPGRHGEAAAAVDVRAAGLADLRVGVGPVEADGFARDPGLTGGHTAVVLRRQDVASSRDL